MRIKTSVDSETIAGGSWPQTWCPRCGNPRFTTIVDTHVIDAGLAAPLEVDVEIRGCEACRRPSKPSASRRAAEIAAVRLVAFSGQVNGRTFRFMRRTMGLQSKALARLLGLGPGTISRWENGVRSLDTNVWVLVASLALELADGEENVRTMRILESVRAASVAEAEADDPVRT